MHPEKEYIQLYNRIDRMARKALNRYDAQYLNNTLEVGITLRELGYEPREVCRFMTGSVIDLEHNRSEWRSKLRLTECIQQGKNYLKGGPSSFNFTGLLNCLRF